MKDLFKKLGYNNCTFLDFENINIKENGTSISFVFNNAYQENEELILKDLDFLQDYLLKSNITDIDFENVPKQLNAKTMKRILEIAVFNVKGSPLNITKNHKGFNLNFKDNSKFYIFRKEWEKKFENKVVNMGFAKDAFKFSVLDGGFNIGSPSLKSENKIDDYIDSKSSFSNKGFSSYEKKKIREIPFSKREVKDIDYGVSIKGEIFKVSMKDFGETKLYEIGLTDKEDSIICKKFVKDDSLNGIRENQKVIVNGKVKFDDYNEDVVLFADNIKVLEENSADEKKLPYKGRKRVELSAHTTFSASEGVASVDMYSEKILSKGIDKIAITDIENVQSFPEAEKKLKDKIIYGTKFNVYSNEEDNVYFGEKRTGKENIVSIDLETTGFSTVFDDIIEIGATRYSEDGLEEFNRLVKLTGKRKLTNKISSLTGINKEMLDKDGIDAKEALAELYDFLGENPVIVAQNAQFDFDFLRTKYKAFLGIDFNPDYIDTLALSKRVMSDEMKRFNLGALTKKLGISLENAHRASDDATATLKLFFKLVEKVEKKDVDLSDQIPSGKVFLEMKFSGKKNNEIFEEEKEKGGFVVDQFEKTEQKRGFKIETTLVFECNDRLLEFVEIVKKTTMKIVSLFRKEEKFLNDLTLLNEIEGKGVLTREFGQLNVIAKNQKGLKEMFKLISKSYENISYGKPMISDEEIFGHENILVGSGDVTGLFKVYYEKGEEKGIEIMKKIDYLEVSPTSKYFSVVSEFADHYGIKKTLHKMVENAEKMGKPVVATSGSYYIDKDEKENWEFYIDSPRLGGGFHKIKNAVSKGDHSLLTPFEMEEGIRELFPNKVEEYVYTNPNNLIKDFEAIKIIREGLFAPADDFMKEHNIPSVKKEFFKVLNEALKTKYEFNGKYNGVVKDRVKKEVESILGNGFEGIYYISYALVKKSNEEGYVVGSRGSVGSSFVANLMGITEINPLKPHYRCPKCNEVIFIEEVKSGYDLEKKKCSACDVFLERDGQDIPFETFLGFKGDKVPDIDLNFSGEYQSKAHEFSRDIFGADKAFRAGTISTFAEKNAFGVVKGFYERRNITKRNAEIQRKAKKLEGVKRTTGQHPGGIIIVPKQYEIEDFTPTQYPANKMGEWKTTHFDFHAIHDNLLKLDILGHDDPTTLKVLMDMLKDEENPPFKEFKDIPINEPEIFELFQKEEPMTNGIPEFGTPFVQEMLKDTKPKTFNELVKISGLSHGTDVWLNNAKELVAGSTGERIAFENVIGCRDDIMVFLMANGLDDFVAFQIMEFVRKGKPNVEPEKWEEFKKILKDKNIPGWYIWSMEKIKYMFPKAHAAAYVLSALRIAWFKVNRPLYFYSAYFQVRAKNIDIQTIIKGVKAIDAKIVEIEENPDASEVDKNKIPSLKVAKDAWSQNVRIAPPDINKSKINEFTLDLEKNSLIASLTSIDGLGENVAKDIIDKRKDGLYKDLEDLKQRTKANKRHVENLEKMFK